MKYKNLYPNIAPRRRAATDIPRGCTRVVRLLALAVVRLSPLSAHSPEAERAEVVRLFPPIPDASRVCVGYKAAARHIAAVLRDADVCARASGNVVIFSDPRREYVCDLIFEELDRWKRKYGK